MLKGSPTTTAGITSYAFLKTRPAMAEFKENSFKNPTDILSFSPLTILRLSWHDANLKALCEDVTLNEYWQGILRRLPHPSAYPADKILANSAHQSHFAVVSGYLLFHHYQAWCNADQPLAADALKILDDAGGLGCFHALRTRCTIAKTDIIKGKELTPEFLAHCQDLATRISKLHHAAGCVEAGALMRVLADKMPSDQAYEAEGSSIRTLKQYYYNQALAYMEKAAASEHTTGSAAANAYAYPYSQDQNLHDRAQRAFIGTGAFMSWNDIRATLASSVAGEGETGTIAALPSAAAPAPAQSAAAPAHTAGTIATLPPEPDASAGSSGSSPKTPAFTGRGFSFSS